MTEPNTSNLENLKSSDEPVSLEEQNAQLQATVSMYQQLERYRERGVWELQMMQLQQTQLVSLQDWSKQQKDYMERILKGFNAVAQQLFDIAQGLEQKTKPALV